MKNPTLFLFALTVGCGSSTSTLATRPHWLYTMDEGKAHALAYDSRGRGAYIAPNKDHLFFLCAEPPPDASANLSSTSSSATSVDLAATYAALAAKAGISNATQSAISSQITDVAQRSETTLLMRDMLYRLCEMEFNGYLTDDSAKASFDDVLQATLSLGARDNVAKLVSVLGTEDLDDQTRHQIIVAVLAMSLAHNAESTRDKSVQSAQSAAANELLKQITPTAAPIAPVTTVTPAPPPAPKPATPRKPSGQ